MPLLNNAQPKGRAILSLDHAYQATKEAQQHWGEVQSVLQAFGRNEIDPITATRKVHELTGGKSIPQVVDEMGTLLESLVKFRPGS